MDSVSQLSHLRCWLAGSLDQYFSVASLAALINFNAFFFFFIRSSTDFLGFMTAKKDILPLECLDQSRQ